MNDLSRGIERDRQEIEKAVSDVLDSGYVVMGPQVKAFEQELAAYVGVPWALGVASGTDALELAIKATMPLGKQTVLTAANAGGYASTAALRAGFRVRYADIESDSLCVSDRTILEALSDDVGVVVVTHLYGNLTDIRGLVESCNARGIRVVEDCAQSLGARVGDRAAGTFGDVGAISFYPTKNLGALGDGGAIVTGNAEYAASITRLRQYAWDPKYRATTSGGMNSRLDELQAAILRIRLPKLDSFNERRREIIQRYVEAASDSPLRVLPASDPHHVAHLAVGLSRERDDIRDHFSQHGIQTDIHFPYPDYSQPGFESELRSLPRTEAATRQIFTLPCFPELTDEEVDQVCEAIRGIALAQPSTAI